MPKDKSKYITLRQIIYDTTEDVKIPGIGIVKVKDPTEEDYIESEVSASKHPMWDKWDDIQKVTETRRQLARRMIVEPEISEEDYAKSDRAKMEIILDTILMHYTVKITKLNAKRGKAIRDFLELMKERS